MTNLDRATKIRRTVANKAYQLLQDCKEPEPAFDGFEGYMQEHWSIDFDDLWYEVVRELQQIWEFEEGDKIDKQIKTHVENFFENDYKAFKDEFARRYYQHQKEQREEQEYQRAHQPSWRP